MAKKKSRTKFALMNVAMSFTSEIVSLVCGLVLPRLILVNYGSAYNGITTSISQFMSVIALMKAGIGGATKAALYKPLAENDKEEISVIMMSTEKFMHKVMFLFLGFVAILAIAYPLFINSEFDFIFTASLIMIMGIGNFSGYFYGYTYQLLFMADQKEYVLTFISIFQIIAGTLTSVILINSGFGIHIIEGGAALVSTAFPVFLCLYTRRKYQINTKAKPDMSKLPGRWDAVAHETATFVNNNTDIVVLTMFTSLATVSIYTIYHAVIGNIKKIIKLSVANFASAFGDMYAKGEHELIEENLGVFELIINSMVSVAHSVTLVMIVPFALVYTSGVTDANYSQFGYAVIAVIASAFDCFRMPYKTIVTAIGHFKQTRNGAIFEAVLNIVISVACVIKLGLVGVAIGTLFAMVFRTIQYSYYLSKSVLKRSMWPFIRHVTLSLTIILAVNVLSRLYMPSIDSWFMWFVYAIITTLIALAITISTDFIFYKKDLMILIRKLTNTLFKKKKRA